MSATHTDKINLIFVHMKTIAKKTLPPSFICDISNHTQGNSVIEIKQISWSRPDPFFFKNKYPNPILIRKNPKYAAGYPILILPMLTSGVRIRKVCNPDPIRNFFIKSISNPYPKVKNCGLRYPIQILNCSLSCTIAYIFGSVYFAWKEKAGLWLFCRKSYTVGWSGHVIRTIH